MKPRKHTLRIVLELQGNHKIYYVMTYLMAVLYEANMLPSPTDPCGSAVQVGTQATFEWELVDAPVDAAAWHSFFYEVNKRLMRSFACSINVERITVIGEMQLSEELIVPMEA